MILSEVFDFYFECKLLLDKWQRKHFEESLELNF